MTLYFCLVFYLRKKLNSLWFDVDVYVWNSCFFVSCNSTDTQDCFLFSRQHQYSLTAEIWECKMGFLRSEFFCLEVFHQSDTLAFLDLHSLPGEESFIPLVVWEKKNEILGSPPFYLSGIYLLAGTSHPAPTLHRAGFMASESRLRHQIGQWVGHCLMKDLIILLGIKSKPCSLAALSSKW